MRALVLVLVLLSAPNAKSAEAAGEDAYLQARDKFITRFKADCQNPKQGGPAPVEDAAALAGLERRLKSIIGPRGLAGSLDGYKINLETLSPCDAGYDQADGLMSRSGDRATFITTAYLLEHYLAAHPRLPPGLNEAAKKGLLYSRVFDWDVGFHLIVELPLKKDPNAAVVRAFLALATQDVGPYVPQEVLTFVQRNGQVAIGMTDLKGAVAQIPACKEEWDRYEAQAKTALASRDHKRAKRAEREGFNAYHKCFAHQIENEKIFSTLTLQAQVDGLGGLPR